MNNTLLISAALVIFPLTVASASITSSAVAQTSAPTSDLRLTRSPVGTAVEVSAGQEFYAETRAERVPAYELANRFKSSMAGAMGLPFGFSIDETLLVRYRTDSGGTEYFVPATGKFRAYHGLLGSVLAEGDTVGLRVHPDGSMEWFVNNSIKNGMSTIWSRKYKKKDPALTRIMTKTTRPNGGIFERLVYLGFSGSQTVRIRHEIVGVGEPLRDEFTFPVDANGFGVGAIKGAEFTIHATPLKALITVTKPMTSAIGEAVN